MKTYRNFRDIEGRQKGDRAPAVKMIQKKTPQYILSASQHCTGIDAGNCINRTDTFK
jgi:hypothetical protein